MILVMFFLEVLSFRVKFTLRNRPVTAVTGLTELAQ
jgi:hypothetical protein